MKVELGDHLVVVSDRKKYGGEVVSVHEDKVYIEVDGEKMPFKLEEVVANMGANPKVGSVYGRRVEPLLHSMEHPTWGTIEFYRHLSEVEKKCLKKSLKHQEQIMRDLGIHGIVFPLTLLKIQEAKGKYAGMYKQRGQDREIHFYPPSLSSESEITDLGCHELGHGFWCNGVSEDNKAQWSLLYESYVTKHEVSADVVQHVLSNMLVAEDLPSFHVDLEADEQKAYDAIIGKILASTLMSMEDLYLVHSCRPDDLKFLVPPIEEVVVVGEKETFPVGDYGSRNTVEMFAESFRLYATGKQLPKKIYKLMQKTVGN